jgi:hypothetical protein
LEVHEKGAVATHRVGQLAREHRDALAGGLTVVERDLERMLDGGDSGQRDLSVHRRNHANPWCNAPTPGGFGDAACG